MNRIEFIKQSNSKKNINKKQYSLAVNFLRDEFNSTKKDNKNDYLNNYTPLRKDHIKQVQFQNTQEEPLRINQKLVNTFNSYDKPQTS